jgi:hypothetical protein
MEHKNWQCASISRPIPLNGFAAFLTGQGEDKLHRYDINRQNTVGTWMLNLKYSGASRIIMTLVSKKVKLSLY